MMEFLQEEDSLKVNSIDTGLICLAAAVGILGVEAEEETIRRECGLKNLPMDTKALLQAAKFLKLKAKKIKLSVSKMEEQPIPSIA